MELVNVSGREVSSLKVVHQFGDRPASEALNEIAVYVATERPDILREGMAQVVEAARSYAKAAKSDNTKRGYASDWRIFTSWCEDNGVIAMPASPETVALFLAAEAQAGRKASTLQRRVAAISQAHQAAGHPSPTHDYTVRTVHAGIRREHGTSQNGKAAAVTDDIRAMTEGLSDDRLIDVRDRALILVGFASAMRRSELVALDVADVTFTRQGATVLIRKSKTDQDGEGRKVGVPYGSNPDTCPVRALLAWIEAAGIEDGAIFRSMNRHGGIQGRMTAQSVALIVKKLAEAAGLDPSAYAGHSLRSGLATSAAQAGVSERDIMKQTGHTTERMVRKYIRDGSLFRDNAAAKIGL